MSKKIKNDYSFYNFDKLFSYNAVFNFVVGGRGIGKSYGSKKRVISRFLKTGAQFIYLRRYEEELKEGKSKFFADIESEFVDYDFRVEGAYAKCAPVSTRDDKKRPWKVMGFFVNLSTAQQKKSTSYPMVTEIIFDEFILEKGMVMHGIVGKMLFPRAYSSMSVLVIGR